MVIRGDPTATIIADLRRLSRETRKEVRPKLKEAGEIIAADARSRASWSSRIPRTVRVRVSFRAGGEGVTVAAGGARAPHARPYEGTTQNPFRHPVYGNREVWVAQPARPFLNPAAAAKADEAGRAIEQALAEAAKALGFSG